MKKEWRRNPNSMLLNKSNFMTPKAVTEKKIGSRNGLDDRKWLVIDWLNCIIMGWKWSMNVLSGKNILRKMRVHKSIIFSEGKCSGEKNYQNSNLRENFIILGSWKPFYAIKKSNLEKAVTCYNLLINSFQVFDL